MLEVKLIDWKIFNLKWTSSAFAACITDYGVLKPKLLQATPLASSRNFGNPSKEITDTGSCVTFQLRLQTSEIPFKETTNSVLSLAKSALRTMENNNEEDSSSKPVPTLHHLSSSQSLRILWALEELAQNGQSYKLKTYKREKGRAPAELKSIFPLGKSPILVVDSIPGSPEDQQTVVTESRLILQFLADHYSDGVWETDPRDKRRNEFWQEFSGATLATKVTWVMLFDIIAPHAPCFVRPLVSAIFNPLATMYKKDLVAPFALMESALSEEQPWFAGPKLGLADFCMSWPMDMAAQRGYFDASTHPKVAEWHERVHARPAYKRALEKGGSYNLATFDF